MMDYSVTVWNTARRVLIPTSAVLRETPVNPLLPVTKIMMSAAVESVEGRPEIVQRQVISVTMEYVMIF